jgi:hypothetical protein
MKVSKSSNGGDKTVDVDGNSVHVVIAALSADTFVSSRTIQLIYLYKYTHPMNIQSISQFLLIREGGWMNE